MAAEQAELSDFARLGHGGHPRALYAFLLLSALVHTAVIVGLPDFLPQFAVSGPGALEVTILAPQPAPAAQPEAPKELPAEEPKATRPRAEPEKKAAPEAAKPPGGAPGPGAAPQAQDAEVVGSFSVGSSRGIAPLATVPDPAAEASAQQVTPPVFKGASLNNPAVPYPDAARRAGLQGTVLMRVMVKRDGLPARVEIEKSSGHRVLDIAAQDAVWSWRFGPGRLGTDPVESWVIFPVVFNLKEPR